METEVLPSAICKLGTQEASGIILRPENQIASGAGFSLDLKPEYKDL